MTAAGYLRSSLGARSALGAKRGVGIFTEDRTQTLDVSVPANGESATVVFDGIVNMDVNAPDVCANAAYEIPITGLQGNRV